MAATYIWRNAKQRACWHASTHTCVRMARLCAHLGSDPIWPIWQACTSHVAAYYDRCMKEADKFAAEAHKLAAQLQSETVMRSSMDGQVWVLRGDL